MKSFVQLAKRKPVLAWLVGTPLFLLVYFIGNIILNLMDIWLIKNFYNTDGVFDFWNRLNFIDTTIPFVVFMAVVMGYMWALSLLPRPKILIWVLLSLHAIGVAWFIYGLKTGMYTISPRFTLNITTIVIQVLVLVTSMIFISGD